MEERIDKAKNILRKLDAQTLQRRAERQSNLPITTYRGNIPSRVFHLLSEADSCFVNGEYNGCVAVLATAVEYSLKKLINSKSKSELKTLIEQAKDQGIIDEQAAEVLDMLRKYRNNVLHSDLSKLAAGIILKRQKAAVTEKGVVPLSEWEEIMPKGETMKDASSSLHAEAVVEKLICNTSSIMCKFYGGILE